MSHWLLDTLLATTGLLLLVLLVREPVRKLFGSRVAYGLWLIPAARLFMPTLRHTVERTVAAPTTFQPIAVPIASESLWMARVAPPPESLFDRLGGLPTVAVALWLAVAAGLFVSRMIAFHRDRRAILGASFAASRVGRVRIVRSPEVVSPVALGILTPIVAVPSDFERRYAPRERRLVLEHELAHHRSGDLIANLFAFVLLCLQWFNPIAWIAHAAFRFDQEAACDARVLDKGIANDRADYGRAIAKAASGRALLFASALDRRNTLHRRLQSMLKSSNPTRRRLGRLLVISGIAAALPLTASRAVDYVDVPVPADPPVPAAAPGIAPVAAAPVEATPATAPATASAAVAPVPPAARAQTFHLRPGQHFAFAGTQVSTAVLSATGAPAPLAAAPLTTFKLTTDDGRKLAILGTAVAPSATYKIVSADGQHYVVKGAPPHDFEIRGNGETFIIDGKAKRWEELTPGEKAEVQRAVAKARAALEKTRLNQAQILREVAAIPERARLADVQRELALTQARVAESVRRIDEQAARERAAGRAPDQLEAAIRATLQSVQAIDLSVASQALANVDRDKIAADVAGAQQSMERAKAELARVQARIDADQHH
jgi:beta-lactamase regulating signal transducer with metallopeptidase domain